MDLVVYETADRSDPQGGILDNAAADRQDMRDHPQLRTLLKAARSQQLVEVERDLREGLAAPAQCRSTATRGQDRGPGQLSEPGSVGQAARRVE
jgi:hypothetical protein